MNLVGSGFLTPPPPPLSIAYPPPLFFQIFSTPLPPPPPVNLQLYCFYCLFLLPCFLLPCFAFFCLFLFLNLNGWSCHSWSVILLNDIMDLHMSSLGTLVPEGLWCVSCNKASSLLRPGTCGSIASTLIGNHTSTQRHTAYTGPRYWHTYNYISTPTVIGYLYYTEWIIRWCWKFTEFHNVFAL